MPIHDATKTPPERLESAAPPTEISTPRTLVLTFCLAFTVLAPLLRRTVNWDGMSFLLQAERGYDRLDYMHLLYPWYLAAATKLGAIFGLESTTSAAAFSALCAALLFTCFVEFLRSFDIARAPARLVAACVLTTPELLRESVSIEVYTPALSGLVLAAFFARRHALRPTPILMTASAVAFVFATSCHAAILLALPWIIRLSRPVQAKTTWRSRAPFLLVLAASLLGGSLLGIDYQNLRDFGLHLRGFLPWWTNDRGAATLLFDHAKLFLRFMLEGVPLLALGAAAAAVLLRRQRRAPIAHAWLLALPFASLFLITGVPILGLLLPVTIALGILLASSYRHSASTDRRLIATLALILTVQLALTVPERLTESRQPDPQRRLAHSIESALPPDAVVIAGRSAQHLRYFTTLEVIALPVLVHETLAAQGQDANLTAATLLAAHQAYDTRRPVFITTDALATLELEGVHQETLANFPVAQPPLLVRETPPFHLFHFQFP